ncbi:MULTISPECIES: phage tail tube protein [Exiguobacterium]|uniref:phage tail tube protein n=1 Tax=Exiguobacterium TaxID=33986 RepID=UPI001AEA5F1A|nr:MULTISPECIES: phage tail tube protein [Exiguobacterium]MCT4779824.1 phage tail tube protein [Exiguobacterium soli]
MAVTGKDVMLGTGMMVSWSSGNKLTYIDRIQVKMSVGKAEIKLPRQIVTKHKTTDVKYSGTIGGFEYTLALQKAMKTATEFRGQDRIDIYCELEDGESGERFKWRIVNVQFTEGDLVNWQVGEVVKKEMQFVCDDAKIINGDNR